jgi:hypothetical protein
MAINEDPDQARCARYLARAFPHASKQEMIDVIDGCQKGLLQMGFGDLQLLRKELVDVHPAWRAKAS